MSDRWRVSHKETGANYEIALIREGSAAADSQSWGWNMLSLGKIVLFGSGVGENSLNGSTIKEGLEIAARMCEAMNSTPQVQER